MSGFSVPVYRAFFQGAVAAGGSINVYVTGTTTFVTCYADGGLVTPISNPITLDANGEAKFYVSGSTNLRIDSYTATGIFIETVDPVLPVAGTSNTAAGSVVYQGTNLTLSTSNLSNNIISTAAINIVLPLSTGFTNSFSVQLNAQGGAITLIPNVSDSIQKQTAGKTYVISQGSTGELWTDAVGNWGINFLSSATYISSAGGYINKIRNGLMSIQQRGSSISVTTGTSPYTFDGWMVGATGATALITDAGLQSINGMIYSHAMQIVGNTSMSDTFIRTRIESIETASFYAQSVTVQIGIVNFTGAALTPTLTVKYPTVADNYASTVTIVNAIALQTIQSTATGILCYTFNAPSNANGLEITFDFGSSLNSGGKFVYLSGADCRQTLGITTGLNNAPPTIEQRVYAAELSFCQRYFETSYNPGIALGASSQNNAGDLQQIAFSTTQFYAFSASAVQFKVTKRSAPALTFYNPSTGASNTFWDYTATAVAGTVVAGTQTINQFGISGSSITAAHVYGTHWAASSEL